MPHIIPPPIMQCPSIMAADLHCYQYAEIETLPGAKEVKALAF